MVQYERSVQPLMSFQETAIIVLTLSTLTFLSATLDTFGFGGGLLFFFELMFALLTIVFALLWLRQEIKANPEISKTEQNS